MRLRMISIATAALAASVAPARAGGGSGAPSCAKPAKRAARAAADKAARAKDLKAAIATLEPFAACQWQDSSGDDLVETAWLIGELAVDYEHVGRPLDCWRAAVPLTDPYAWRMYPSAPRDKVVSALAFNVDRCAKAFEAGYAAVKTDACPIAIDGAPPATAVPAALVPKGATAACLALVGPPPPDAEPHYGGHTDADDKPVTCPVVTAVWKTAHGVQQRALRSSGDGDQLTNQTLCCRLDTIAIGAIRDKTLVRVRGLGAECNGAEADVDDDAFYVLDGGLTSLALQLDASVFRR